MKANLWYFSILLIIFLKCSLGEDASIKRGNDTGTDEGDDYRLKWREFESSLKQGIGKALRILLPTAMEASGKVNISANCVKSLLHLVFGVRQLKSWAFKFLDAWGKPPGGILEGAIFAPGSYEECVNNVVMDRRGKESFRGKYCTVAIHPPLPPQKLKTSIHNLMSEMENITEKDTVIHDMISSSHYFYFLSMRLGSCIPSTCTSDDILRISTEVSKTIGVNWEITVPSCEVKEEVSLNRGQIAVISIIAITVLIVLLGTALDLLSTFHGSNSLYKFLFNKSSFVKFILSFSAYTNAKKLLNTNVSEDSLGIIHGMRVISLAWIILSHTYLYINFFSYRNLARTKDFTKEVVFQMVNNGYFAVDTFFFISGVLVAYWRASSRNASLNVPLFICRRLWRLLPSYSIIIGITFLLPLMGSGPIWHETVDPLVNNCRDNWWTNLLFINNYINDENICLEHSWYLAVDTQLYIFFLVVLIPLARWPTIAMAINLVILVASIVTSYVINYMNDLAPTGLVLYPDPINRLNFTTHVYFKPYCHIAAYCVGITVGYLLGTRRNMKINKMVQFAAWCLSTVFSITIIFGIYNWNSGTTTPLAVESALYASTSRFVWSLCIGWVTVACLTGHGGFVTKFLSWKAFIPLSRLTYFMYLLHPLIQFCYNAFPHELHNLHHFTFMYMFLGHMVLSFGLAIVCTLTFETPFMNIEKIMFPAKKKDALPVTVSDVSSQLPVAKTPSYTIGNINLSLEKDGLNNQYIDLKIPSYMNGDLKAAVQNDDTDSKTQNCRL